MKKGLILVESNRGRVECLRMIQRNFAKTDEYSVIVCIVDHASKKGSKERHAYKVIL